MSLLKSDNRSHLERMAFFDGECGIQRYDTARHKMISKINGVMLSQFWRPEEIDVTSDKADFDSLTENEKHIFLSNLKRQIVLDSVQGREPLNVFLPLASTPETELAITEWSFQETIHSLSYTHIIRGALNDPSEVFDHVLEIQEIADLASDISKYYDELDTWNTLRECCENDDLPSGVVAQAMQEYDEYEHKKAFWKAMFAVNALEGIRFYVSFACSWAFMEIKEKMEGNAKIIKLICRDENNHLKLTQTYLNRILKEDPDFIKIREECQDEMVKLFLDVVEQEKEWAKYLFQNGGMLGLNVQICCDYIDWLADKRMSAIGMNYPLPVPEKNPLPWTQHWIAGDIKQTALQEAENDSYLLGALEGNMKEAAQALSFAFPAISNTRIDDVVVYTRSGCPFCSKAIELLNANNIKYTVKSLDVDFSRDDFIALLPEHHKTFPAIFSDDKLVGGYSELKEYFERLI